MWIFIQWLLKLSPLHIKYIMGILATIMIFIASICIVTLQTFDPYYLNSWFPWGSADLYNGTYKVTHIPVTFKPDSPSPWQGLVSVKDVVTEPTTPAKTSQMLCASAVGALLICTFLVYICLKLPDKIT